MRMIWKEKVLQNKVLIFPGGKGSSVVQADGLYQLKMRHNMPAAMVIQYRKLYWSPAQLLWEVPMVDKSRS